MPIIIKDTDRGDDVGSPEYDHRIEVGSAEYHELLKKVPALGSAAGETVLIMRKNKAWKIDPVQKKWKLTLQDDDTTYMRFEDAIRLETKIGIGECKEYVKKRAKINPKLAVPLKDDPLSWSWDKAVDDLGWPDYNNLAVRTKFTSSAAASPQIRSVGAWSGCYIGNGLILSCGHHMQEIYNDPGEFMVIFGWNSQVEKRYYSLWAIAEIERFLAWDEGGYVAPQELGLDDDGIPPTYMTKLDYDHLKVDARKWDGAIMKLRFAETPPKELKGLTIAPLPATFDDTLFSTGCPLGSQVKVSPDLRVLRYDIDWDNDDWKSTNINKKPMARFATNIENFGGHSGGPVVNSATGQIVGIVSSAPTTSTVTRLDLENPLREGNDAMQSLNRHIMEVEGKAFMKDGPKVIPKSKALQPSDLCEFAAPWVVCQNGDRMPNGQIKQAKDGSDFTYLIRYPEKSPAIYTLNLSCRADKYALMLTPIETILKNPDQYHIVSVTVEIEVPSAVDENFDLELHSSWGTTNAPVTTASVKEQETEGIFHEWCTHFARKGEKIVGDPFRSNAPALPVDLTKSPLGITDWIGTAFSVKAVPNTELKDKKLQIRVTYNRADFDLGKVRYPKEAISGVTRGPLSRGASDTAYKPELFHWRTEGL